MKIKDNDKKCRFKRRAPVNKSGCKGVYITRTCYPDVISVFSSGKILVFSMRRYPCTSYSLNSTFMHL